MDSVEHDEAVEGVPVCGAVADHCICGLPPHDDDVAHLCKCQGSWRGVIDTDNFDVVAYPVRVPS